MKKAKTRKNLLTILSAIFGVVFAFLTGFTYCATSLNLIYGMKENSTSAFMGNQQFHLINDTKSNPVQFNEGAHNFEIALQYSFDYDFDLRVSYSLSWSKLAGEENSISTDNVILNFANRDNIIYDENYIYFANSFSAGSGKVSIIAGVEFVDPTDTNYDGRTLTITIEESDVKIRKAQSSYAGVPGMISDVVTLNEDDEIDSFNSVAAQAWLQYKLNSTAGDEDETNSYVMMYNYRRDYEHGFQYPGPATTYKKPVSTADGIIHDTPVKTLGNRGYAGTGMYVIAGDDNLELEVQVSGIWRTQDQAELTSENNIQYNYAKDWEFAHYSLENGTSPTGLWDVRTFTYYIKANTGCYIDILDSVEITSAGIKTTTAYRLVTNSIVVNSTTFAYGEGSNISKFDQITSKVSTKGDNFKYTQENITVVNTTKYNNGLYNSAADAQQTYNGNISLINNTEQTRQLTIGLGLKYHISNGKENLYQTGDADKKRAIDLIDRAETTTLTYQSAFSKNNANSAVNSIYYSYTGEANAKLSMVNNKNTTATYTLVLEPFASVNLLTAYSVSAELGEIILTLFDTSSIDDENITKDSLKEYYNVWTYLVPNVASSIVETSPNLILETKQTETTTIVSVKNNTNKTVTGLSVNDFALRTYTETKSDIQKSAPYDWEASYWKYYAVDDNKQLTTLPSSFDADGYYTLTKSYNNFVINLETESKNYTLLNDFAFATKEVENVETDEKETITDTTMLYNEDKVLLPGESVEILSLNTTGKSFAVGTISTTSVTTQNDLTIINNGTANAYIVNYSTTNSYYLKLSGKHSGTNFKTYDGESFTYYIGVVRPGQIIKLSMTSSAEIAKIAIDYTEDGNYGEFSSGDLTGWSDNAKASMINYFNVNKVKETE